MVETTTHIHHPGTKKPWATPVRETDRIRILRQKKQLEGHHIKPISDFLLLLSPSPASNTTSPELAWLHTWGSWQGHSSEVQCRSTYAAQSSKQPNSVVHGTVAEGMYIAFLEHMHLHALVTATTYADQVPGG